MSHTEIVATSVYIIHRDTEIVGGDILIKQVYRVDEDV